MDDLPLPSDPMGGPKPRMSRDAKFGYGFLLAGVGMPYLIDYLFGPTAAFIVAFVCSLAGAGFLVFAHTHGRNDLRRVQIWMAIGLVLVALGGSGWRVVHMESERQPKTPSFPFVFGAPLGDNVSPVWMMMFKHYGPNPAYNCSVEFYDEDRKHVEYDWLAKHPKLSFVPEEVTGGESQKFFHISELDPVDNPDRFEWRPLDPNNQHYGVEIICRGSDGQFHEDWEVSRIDGSLRTSIKLGRPSPALKRNPDLPAVIFECTDTGFTNFPLLSTMPPNFDISAPINPGWKPHHRFEMPVVIIDPNNNTEVVGMKGVSSLGCWDLLTKHFGN